MPIIEIQQLTKVYQKTGQTAVDKLSLSIEQGSFFGLLGPNGAGKTTTIFILCGLLKATEGIIRLAGKAIRNNQEALKKIIGVVPQEIALFPTLSARENLRYFAAMYGLKGKNTNDRIDKLLDKFGLLPAADKRIENYSGGMKRRVNLIAGILHQPQILFLDEPTVGIDVQSKTVITDYLRQLNKEGMTIVYTSHHLREAEELCSEIAIIDQGKIIAQGSPKQLISQNPNTADLEAVFLHLTGRHLRD